jgi:hypothetical protein
MTPWRKGAQGSRARASQALAWTHRTNYVAIQQVVKQSQPVSRMTFDKLSLSLTLLIRISTMICYASRRSCMYTSWGRYVRRHSPPSRRIMVSRCRGRARRCTSTGISHIPTGFVVAQEASDVESSSRLDFPIGGFSPPEGRLARGFKPPAFSRFLFQSAVKSAESF